MNFTYNDEQAMLRESVDRFGAERWNVAERLERLAEGSAGTRRRWAEMAELGWLMLPIAAKDGGLGGSAVDVMAVMEGFGRHLMTEPYATCCVLAPALMASGGDLATELLERIGTGEARVAAALLEDDGYAVLGVDTCATQTDGGPRLTGHKVHAEDGGDADWFIVSARTAGSYGERDGISLFLVPADAQGLRVRRYRSSDGHRHCSLTLDNVPATPIGDRDGGAIRIAAAADRAIAAHLAEAVGSMEAATAATLDYARTRQQFGAPIGSFQVVQHKLVDMTIAAEEARALASVAANSLDSGSPDRALIAAARVRVSQCGVTVAQASVQLHGGVGVCEELIVSHHLRRQMMLDLILGDRDYHRARYVTLSEQ